MSITHNYSKRSLFTPSDLYPGELIVRRFVDVCNLITPTAQAFVLVGKPLIAQAASCKPHQGTGQWTNCSGEYSRLTADHFLSVSDYDRGWIIGRFHRETGDEHFLAYSSAPLLCPNNEVAKLLADVCFPNPPSELALLQWIEG